MDDVIVKGFGFWLLAVIEGILTFASFYLGKITNGLDPLFGMLISNLLGATQVLLFLIVRHCFKLPEKEAEPE